MKKFLLISILFSIAAIASYEKPYGILQTGALFYSISKDCSQIKAVGKYKLSPAAYYKLQEINCPQGKFIFGSFEPDFISLSGVNEKDLILTDE